VSVGHRHRADWFGKNSMSQSYQKHAVSTAEAANPPNDYFVEQDGVRFAGTHLIIDLWGAKRLDDIAYIEGVLRECVRASGATLLHIHLHHFTDTNGVSGIAVLAESHISIHSWPEHGYAAMDVFMCGETEPHRAVDVLRAAFESERIEIGEHRRGMMA
jgi:S-adenosylmethionine decarboxylase